MEAIVSLWEFIAISCFDLWTHSFRQRNCRISSNLSWTTTGRLTVQSYNASTNGKSRKVNQRFLGSIWCDLKCQFNSRKINIFRRNEWISLSMVPCPTQRRNKFRRNNASSKQINYYFSFVAMHCLSARNPLHPIFRRFFSKRNSLVFTSVVSRRLENVCSKFCCHSIHRVANAWPSKWENWKKRRRKIRNKQWKQIRLNDHIHFLHTNAEYTMWTDERDEEKNCVLPLVGRCQSVDDIWDFVHNKSYFPFRSRTVLCCAKCESNATRKPELRVRLM